MTRVHYNPSSSKRGDISTTDTWTLARSKDIKQNSTSNSGRDYYDPHERNIYTPVGREVVTHNKFDLLEDHNNYVGKQPRMLENTDYDRVVKSSDRGTLGENNISNKNISNNTFSKTLNRAFNNNFNGASNIFNDSFSQTLGNDDYERVVKRSDRGTLGGK